MKGDNSYRNDGDEKCDIESICHEINSLNLSSIHVPEKRDLHNSCKQKTGIIYQTRGPTRGIKKPHQTPSGELQLSAYELKTESCSEENKITPKGSKRTSDQPNLYYKYYKPPVENNDSERSDKRTTPESGRSATMCRTDLTIDGDHAIQEMHTTSTCMPHENFTGTESDLDMVLETLEKFNPSKADQHQMNSFQNENISSDNKNLMCPYARSSNINDSEDQQPADCNTVSFGSHWEMQKETLPLNVRSIQSEKDEHWQTGKCQIKLNILDKIETTAQTFTEYFSLEDSKSTYHPTLLQDKLNMSEENATDTSMQDVLAVISDDIFEDNEKKKLLKQTNMSSSITQLNHSTTNYQSQTYTQDSDLQPRKMWNNYLPNDQTKDKHLEHYISQHDNLPQTGTLDSQILQKMTRHDHPSHTKTPGKHLQQQKYHGSHLPPNNMQGKHLQQNNQRNYQPINDSEGTYLPEQKDRDNPFLQNYTDGKSSQHCNIDCGPLSENNTHGKHLQLHENQDNHLLQSKFQEHQLLQQSVHQSNIHDKHLQQNNNLGDHLPKYNAHDKHLPWQKGQNNYSQQMTSTQKARKKTEKKQTSIPENMEQALTRNVSVPCTANQMLTKVNEVCRRQINWTDDKRKPYIHQVNQEMSKEKDANLFKKITIHGKMSKRQPTARINRTSKKKQGYNLISNSKFDAKLCPDSNTDVIVKPQIVHGFEIPATNSSQGFDLNHSTSQKEPISNPKINQNVLSQEKYDSNGTEIKFDENSSELAMKPNSKLTGNEQASSCAQKNLCKINYCDLNEYKNPTSMTKLQQEISCTTEKSTSSQKQQPYISNNERDSFPQHTQLMWSPTETNQVPSFAFSKSPLKTQHCHSGTLNQAQSQDLGHKMLSSFGVFTSQTTSSDIPYHHGYQSNALLFEQNSSKLHISGNLNNDSTKWSNFTAEYCPKQTQSSEDFLRHSDFYPYTKTQIVPMDNTSSSLGRITCSSSGYSPRCSSVQGKNSTEPQKMVEGSDGYSTSAPNCRQHKSTVLLNSQQILNEKGKCKIEMCTRTTTSANPWLLAIGQDSSLPSSTNINYSSSTTPLNTKIKNETQEPFSTDPQYRVQEMMNVAQNPSWNVLTNTLGANTNYNFSPLNHISVYNNINTQPVSPQIHPCDWSDNQYNHSAPSNRKLLEPSNHYSSHVPEVIPRKNTNIPNVSMLQPSKPQETMFIQNYNTPTTLETMPLAFNQVPCTRFQQLQVPDEMNHTDPVTQQEIQNMIPVGVQNLMDDMTEIHRQDDSSHCLQHQPIGMINGTQSLNNSFQCDTSNFRNKERKNKSGSNQIPTGKYRKILPKPLEKK